MTLKEELNNLVNQYQIQTGVVNQLTEQAYEDALTKIRNHASNGRKIADIVIHFTGCKGGYEQHFDLIKSRVASRLTKEGLRVGESRVQSAISVEW